MYQQINLPNGARLLTQHLPQAQSAALGFFVGLFLGWKLYRWLWRPKIVRDKKEGK